MECARFGPEVAFVIKWPGLVPLLAPLEAQRGCRLCFDFSGRHWPALQLWHLEIVVLATLRVSPKI